MLGGASVSSVQVVVNNRSTAGGARALHASPPLTAVDPGSFLNLPSKRAATPVPAGGYIILFITGAGPIAPPLSLINAPVQVTIGGQPAR